MQMRNEFAGDQKDEDVAMTAHNSINRDTQGYNIREKIQSRLFSWKFQILEASF